MNSRTDIIQTVVALLTAIISEQEDIAYDMVLESDPIELFSALTGILFSVLKPMVAQEGITIEDYLKKLAIIAYNPE
jgi:hypothetical protein